MCACVVEGGGAKGERGEGRSGVEAPSSGGRRQGRDPDVDRGGKWGSWGNEVGVGVAVRVWSGEPGHIGQGGVRGVGRLGRLAPSANWAKTQSGRGGCLLFLLIISFTVFI